MIAPTRCLRRLTVKDSSSPAALDEVARQLLPPATSGSSVMSYFWFRSLELLVVVGPLLEVAGRSRGPRLPTCSISSTIGGITWRTRKTSATKATTKMSEIASHRGGRCARGSGSAGSARPPGRGRAPGRPRSTTHADRRVDLDDDESRAARPQPPSEIATATILNTARDSISSRFMRNASFRSVVAGFPVSARVPAG